MLLITTVLSIAAIIAGNVVLLGLVLLMSRSRKKKRSAEVGAPSPAKVATQPALEAAQREPELVEEPELIEELVEEPEQPESIIIANDYEKEAQPVRSGPEFLDDSFVDLFEEVPVVTSADLSWQQKHQRRSRMANRLDRLTAPPSEPSRPSSDSRTTKPNRPLPMPVAPAGVEPIPELEPTELMIDRPEWAAEWP